MRVFVSRNWKIVPRISVEMRAMLNVNVLTATMGAFVTTRLPARVIWAHVHRRTSAVCSFVPLAERCGSARKGMAHTLTFYDMVF